jgi:hypothetical protein
VLSSLLDIAFSFPFEEFCLALFDEQDMINSVPNTAISKFIFFIAFYF